MDGLRWQQCGHSVSDLENFMTVLIFLWITKIPKLKCAVLGLPLAHDIRILKIFNSCETESRFKNLQNSSSSPNLVRKMAVIRPSRRISIYGQNDDAYCN